MKKIFGVFFVILTLPALSQSLIGGDNIIKTNLTSDLLKNYNITYERSINHFISLSASFRTMPMSSLPLKVIAKQFIDNPNIDFDNFKIGNNALTLEGRFYIGMQKMSGIYIAPYIRYANFDVAVPVKYTYTPAPINGVSLPAVTTTAALDGTIRSTAMGAYFGIQYQLLTKLVLDLWIAGGSYGSSNGKLGFVPPVDLPAPAVSSLQKTLDETSIHPFNMKSTVTSKGATINTDGPWAGFRGLGLTVGVRF
jgi:hypothetical protein